jgi:hypothetical protein
LRSKSLLLAALVLGSIFTIAPPASAAETHCAASVVGQRPSGEYVLSPMVCRSSRTSALQAIGAVNVSGFSTQATFVIGTHYDGASFTGSSFSVTGSDCSGGWLNLSSTWDNRVSSTLNGCPVIRHYDGDNLTGAIEGTVGAGGNLSALNNKTQSIKYSS